MVAGYEGCIRVVVRVDVREARGATHAGEEGGEEDCVEGPVG